MDGQPNIKLLAGLALIVVALLIGVMLYLYSGLFQQAEEPVAETTPAPSERFEPTTLNVNDPPLTEPLPVAEPTPAPDPREQQLDALLDTFRPQEPVSDGAGEAADSENAESPFSIDDLYAVGLQPDPTPTSPQTEPAPLPEGFVPGQTVEYTPVELQTAEFEPEQLRRTRFGDCGSIEIPTGALSQYSLMNNLAQEPTVQCLGRAVAQNCSGQAVEVESADFDSTLYVVKNNEDRCALGFRVEREETITLCGLEPILEARGGDQSWEEWEDAFQADPGGMMADVVAANAQFLLGVSGVTGVGCQVYEL